MKNLAILGSTGSIGTQALKVISNNKDKFNVVVLSCNSNTTLLREQVTEFRPKIVVITDEKAYMQSKHLFTDVEVLCGSDALSDVVALSDVDIVLAGIVGMGGFESVYDAVKNGKNVALANKESLVSGGELIMALAEKNNVDILPVDSEHSAVWQCLQGSKKSNLKRIVLTASGGAFYGYSKAQLQNVTVEMATSHPNWSMGKKITVDSATMMNKGLEIIEARHLFDTQNIDYIIHRQSIIHSMVEFVDGTYLAQMSNPNMEFPIALALSYPDRLNFKPCPESNWFGKSLTFDECDEDTFIMPRLAKNALKVGDNAPCILNAVNEACVSLFLQRKISFLDIFSIVSDVMDSANFAKLKTKEDVVGTHNYWFNKLMTDYN